MTVSEGELDLDRRTREVLDFDELLDWVAALCRTEPGRLRVLGTRPSSDAQALGEELATLAEVLEHVASEGALVPAGLPDPLEAAAALALPGRALGAAPLHALASVAQAVWEVGSALRRLEPQRAARLRRLGQAFPDLRRQAEAVLRHVSPEGGVADEASEELGRIRRARARTAERLRRKLEGYLHRPDAPSVIRDDFITQRNGRFVIPVRSDAPHPVQGIVHASSSSGATHFVEPLETVELNNELVRLEEAETREIERLLALWSEGFRERLEAVEGAVAALGELDALEARARFAREIDGVLPRVAPAGELHLVELRHPLLDRRLRAAGRRSVPMSVALQPFDRVLVLSGPNAGGKTVSLKTIGLAVLMAQSAIPLPARDVRLPAYRQVRADVGDHQSIAADLSTFTAHVGALASFFEHARPPVLLLLDEIGSGTDPAEGAALACAVLEALLRPGFTAVATTHQGPVKAWAQTTAGAESAALEFDTSALRPTYRVIAGAAGVSAGLEIARRAGLEPRIVDRARALRGDEGGRVEAFLDRLHALRRELEGEREQIEAERRALADEHAAAMERVQETLAGERREASERLEAAIRSLGRDVEREIGRIEDARERARVKARVGQAAESARRQAIPREKATEEAAPKSLDRPAETGMAVRVVSLGRDGVVERVEGGSVVVRIGALPVTVRGSDLAQAVGGGGGKGDIPRFRAARKPPPVDDLGQAPSELRLIGKTIEEGLSELDKFLDEAALAGRQELRIVHGHGTGRLRRAVREFLLRHVHVRAHRPGAPNEGGDGATIVTLK